MNKDIVISLWKNVFKIRLVEDTIIKFYPEQEMRCPVHLSNGEEAISAGVCESLADEDMVFSTHRCHGHYIAKGGDLKAMMAEIYGKEDGCNAGRGGSMHLADHKVNFIEAHPIVGSSTAHAVGAGLSARVQNKNHIIAVFFGDASVEQGIFHESINFASLKNLPILFICENNFYSTFTNFSERQPIEKRKIHELAKAHGVKAYKADGNNVVTVFETSKMAVDHIKENGGPVFLEFETYRIMEHCGPNNDNHLGYRPKAEYEYWENKDCVTIANEIMLETGVSEKEIKIMEEKIIKEVEEAFIFAKNAKFPDKQTIKDRIYAK